LKRFTTLTLALAVTVLILLSANVFADDVIGIAVVDEDSGNVDKPIIILPNPDSNEPVVDPDYEWIKRELGYDPNEFIGICSDEYIKDWYEFVYSNPMVSPYEMLNWYGKITLDEFKAMYGR